MFSRRKRNRPTPAQATRPEPTVEETMELLARDAARFALSSERRADLRVDKVTPTN